jgi:POT family proton-dependent oligopeptide transporter
MNTSAVSPNTSNKMPAGIPFIVGNEAAERFCYYGMRAILVAYMTKYLVPAFDDARATEWLHMFQFAAYILPWVGALIADIVLGKFLTIMSFSIIYAAGTVVLAVVPGEAGLFWGLGLIALGTGGIKPCVSANVGDQFTESNKHLIEKAFGWFYMSINAGSLLSPLAIPYLLEAYGARVAFAVPGFFMVLATVIFYLGKSRFVVVPPTGAAYLTEIKNGGWKVLLKLASVYIFISVFWSLYDQTASTWVLQAQSDLMVKKLFGDVGLDASQMQFVNPLFILLFTPIFSYFIYPAAAKVVKVTPLRKIGVGFLLTALAFWISGNIEEKIMNGQRVSEWWQVLAYAVITAGEVMVSITALEFSFKQAPNSMKSTVMSLYLTSVAMGNLIAAQVNHQMVQPIPFTAVQTGSQTWVLTEKASDFIQGQKISFGDIQGVKVVLPDNKDKPLSGTYLVAETQNGRVRIMDAIQRQDVNSTGLSKGGEVTTYKLVGRQYYDFFTLLMLVATALFAGVALFYQDKEYVQNAAKAA